MTSGQDSPVVRGFSVPLVPLVPRAVLFGDPERSAPEVSPDGRLLGYLAPYHGVMNLWVGPLDGSAEPVPMTDDRGRGVAAFGFCHDDRSIVYLQDVDGDENWRLYQMDRSRREPARCRTPDEVQVRILGHNRWNRHTMLLGMNAESPRLHDVYRLDLRGGEPELVVRNPGYSAWLIDNDLRVRGAASVTAEGGMQIRLSDVPNGVGRSPGAGDAPEPAVWREVPPEDAASTNVLGFDREGHTLYLLSSVDANASRLIAVDLASGVERVLARHERWDVGRVELDPRTLRPVAAVFVGDRDEWTWLDPEFGREVDELRGRLPVDGELRIGRSDRSDRTWLLSVTPSDDATSYFIHERDTNGTAKPPRPLFRSMPELASHELAPMEPFAFTARDDIPIHGYVTFPPKMPRNGLPAVLKVHGGPWTRDVWSYQPEVQWLANRGYLCIQVNFRGSRGFGREFCNAGDREWGRAMQHDLLDAVRCCVERGWADPDRIGIMGTSYGGYAALAGAAFAPGVFRCAIDLCGPANLLTLLSSIPSHWKPMMGFMHAKVGHPEADREMLWERSPLSRVDAIDIPILIGHGENDPRVKRAEAEQIVAALVEKGLPHRYLSFPDEGHGLIRPENRERFYGAAEEFLAEHLGGRRET